MGEFWWTAMQCGVHSSSPEWALVSGSAVAERSAREGRERGNGRIHFARGVAVEVMRASRADERGQRQCTVAKCRCGPDAGRPRRRARRPFRQGDGRLIELIWWRLSPKGDGVVDKARVLNEFYKIVNWSKSQIGLDQEIWTSPNRSSKVVALGLNQIWLSAKTAPKTALQALFEHDVIIFVRWTWNNFCSV